MKLIIYLMFLFFGSQLIWAQENSESAPPQEAQFSECENTEECESINESGEDELLQFLMKEVIPSFEHLYGFHPSFNLTFNNKGVTVNECSVGVHLKQTKPFNYTLSEEGLNDFEMHVEVGQALFLSLNLTCDDFDFKDSKQNYKLAVSIQDENLEPSFYGLKVRSFSREQVYLKLWSLELDITVQNQTKQMGVDSNGFVVSLDDPSSINLTPLAVVTSFQVQGTAQLSLPTAENGNRVETQFVARLDGNIYISENGEVVPVVDIRME